MTSPSVQWNVFKMSCVNFAIKIRSKNEMKRYNCFVISIANRTTRAVCLRSERSLSRGFPSLDLDTVLEERSDQEQTQVHFFIEIN